MHFEDMDSFLPLLLSEEMDTFLQPLLFEEMDSFLQLLLFEEVDSYLQLNLSVLELYLKIENICSVHSNTILNKV